MSKAERLFEKNGVPLNKRIRGYNFYKVLEKTINHSYSYLVVSLSHI